MKSVVCYGDSNTFGSNPRGGRWGEDVRWPRVLQKLLGPEYYVIEEGLGGRETVWDDPFDSERNGQKGLPYVLHTHKPIDLIILALGTNDTKTFFQASPDVIAQGMGRLVDLVRNYPYGEAYRIPDILIAAPIAVGDGISSSPFRREFDAESVQKSRKLPALYREIAEEKGTFFIDSSLYAGPSETDQLHMDKEGHLALARAMAEKIRSVCPAGK